MTETLINIQNLQGRISQLEGENRQLKDKIFQLEHLKQDLKKKLSLFHSPVRFEERAYRFELVSIVIISSPQMAEMVSGIVYNVSISGMKIEVGTDFEEGCELIVWISTHEFKTRVHRKMESEPLNDTPLWEYGLQFIDTLPETQRTLQSALIELFIKGKSDP